MGAQAQQTALFKPEFPPGDILPAEDLPTIQRSDSMLKPGRWALFQGDASDLFKGLPEESVDLIITSPPYWGQRSYGNHHNWDIYDEWKAQGNRPEDVPGYEWYRANGGVLGLEPTPDWFTRNLVEIFEQAKPCLKSEGSIWVNLGDTYFARWASIRDNGRQGLGDNPRQRRRVPMGGYRQEKQLLLIPSRFAIAMENRRWILRNDMIWYKPNVPPRPERDRLRLAHEHFFHFVKRPKEGRAKYYYDLSACENGSTDVVTCFVRSGNGGHTATFPLELVQPRVASSCPPGGLVLDPFCGTGRALLAAVSQGRSAIGFDIVPQFLETAQESLHEWWRNDGWQV